MQAVETAAKPLLQIEEALLAARCCSLAFLPPSAANEHPYATQGPSSIECIGQVEDAATQTGATMFTTSDGVCIIACRGSSSIKSFQTNLNIGPVPLITERGAHPTARVHAGFQSASKVLWRELKPLLPAGAGSGGSMPVVVTGHSLGGGTATMLALKLREHSGREPSLITVAGPKLGNGEFREHYRSMMPRTPAFHCVHDTDDVISSNTRLWNDLGFAHVGVFTVLAAGLSAALGALQEAEPREFAGSAAIVLGCCFAAAGGCFLAQRGGGVAAVVGGGAGTSRVGGHVVSL